MCKIKGDILQPRYQIKSLLFSKLIATNRHINTNYEDIYNSEDYKNLKTTDKRNFRMLAQTLNKFTHVS